TEDEAREAIGGNLCRCTGYHNITASVLRAAEIARGEQALEEEKDDDGAASRNDGASRGGASRDGAPGGGATLDDATRDGASRGTTGSSGARSGSRSANGEVER